MEHENRQQYNELAKGKRKGQVPFVPSSTERGKRSPLKKKRKITPKRGKDTQHY